MCVGRIRRCHGLFQLLQVLDGSANALQWLQSEASKLLANAKPAETMGGTDKGGCGIGWQAAFLEKSQGIEMRLSVFGAV